MTKQFSKLELACLAIGQLPIPAIGEIAGTIGMNSITKEMDLFNKSKVTSFVSAAAITGITKLSLYTQFPGYKTAYDYMVSLVV